MTHQPTKTSRPRILLAEDHTIVREGIKLLLSEVLDVVQAADGKEALEKIENCSFDAIVLDIAMPRMNGLDCLAQIRKRDASVPVIMLSAHSDLGYFRRAFQLGATDFVVKQTSAQEILEAVVASIAKGKSKPQPALDVPALTESVQVPDNVLVDTAAAFIHKLNNQFFALTTISKRLTVVTRSASKHEKAAAVNAVADLTATIDSARYILQRFGNTMGRHPGLLKPVDIHKILKDVQSHFATDFPGCVSLDLAPGPCQVKGDHELLWHLFENLIRNALEALEGRKDGQVTVTTSVESSRKMLHIVVRDNGIGITPEDLSRIFDLNYSTKPSGMGVGLYLVRRAAQIHGGQVECQSELGKGTTFTVSLPLTTTEPKDAP